VNAAVRVVLVEDHDLLAEAVQAWFEDVPEADVVSRARSIEEARAAVVRVHPDVVVLDRRLPDGDGIAAIAELKAAAPGVAVLVTTATADRDTVARIDAEGGDGLVLKSNNLDDLVAAVLRVAASG
jgi:DNA-binding NarL/FixJ family response regulator